MTNSQNDNKNEAFQASLDGMNFKQANQDGLAANFINEVDHKYREDMTLNGYGDILTRYPDIATAFNALPTMTDEDQETIGFALRMSIIEATEELIVGQTLNLEESDHSYEADSTVIWHNEKGEVVTPKISMRIKSLVRIYADFPATAFSNPTEMDALLEDIIKETAAEAAE